jgi:hypothetical protein
MMFNHAFHDGLAECDTQFVMGTGRGQKMTCRLLGTQKCNRDGFEPLAPTLAMGAILATLVIAQDYRQGIAGEQGGEGSYSYWLDYTCSNCPADRSLSRGCHLRSNYCCPL